MTQVLTLWNALSLQRRIIVAVATVAVFAAVLGLTRMASTPSFALLYSGLEDAVAGEVIQNLESRSIPYEVRGDALFVPRAQRDEIRLTLASAGLPANVHAGYELLDNLSGFGTTSQMFDAAYWRAKEGELARTIVASPHIRAARVHISQGSTSPFRRDSVPAAAVTVTPAAGGLSPVQARALRFLVASAVSGMTPEDVAVIDGVNGLVYSDDGDTGAQGGTAGDRAVDLRRNVERLLEAHVGHGRSVVEVSLETVTDREVIRERRIDPETRIVISSEVEESTNTSTDSRAPGVTVASNLPDGDAAQTENGQSEARETSTRQRNNYEVSQTEVEIERAPGAIRRLTVAVLIDGVQRPDADGTMVWQPRPEAELEALRELVASAVGYDEARGDVITLQSLPFEPVAALGTAAQAGVWQMAQLDMMLLLRWLAAIVTIIVLGLFVLRPILIAALQRRDGDSYPIALTDASAGARATGNTGYLSETSMGDDARLGPGRQLPGAKPDAVDRLRELIAERQGESVEILRHWMDDRKKQS